MPGCYRVQHVKIQGTGDAVNGTLGVLLSGTRIYLIRQRSDVLWEYPSADPVCVMGKGTAMIVSGMEYGDERKRTVDNVSKIGTVTSEIGSGSAL